MFVGAKGTSYKGKKRERLLAIQIKVILLFCFMDIFV